METRRFRSLRKRFVSRAKYLKMDKGFLAALSQARNAWDRAHPDFLIGPPGKPPSEPCPPEHDVPYPPSLAQAAHSYYQYTRLPAPVRGRFAQDDRAYWK